MDSGTAAAYCYQLDPTDVTATYAFALIRSWEPDYRMARELSEIALDHAVCRGRRRRPAPLELGARNGFQDAPRLPCYRAVRRR